MADRILSVNAYTTLDLCSGLVEGHGFEENTYAVVNVTADREDPDHVELQVEFDNTELDAVEPHADRVFLSASEARELASALEDHADDVAAEGE